MECALCQQLMGAVKDNFICALHRPHLCYSGSSTLDLLNHLYGTYAVIMNADWIANEAYAPTNPIEVI